VAELDGDSGAGVMQNGGEAFEAWEEPVIVDAELAEAVTSGSLRRAHLDRDQADPTERAGL
jgi:hypothetical protein